MVMIRKKTVLIVLVFIILFSLLLLIPVRYNTSIDKNDVISLEDINLKENNFDIINSYCKMSNKVSASPFIFNKEIMIVEIAVDDANDLVGNPHPENNDFYKCTNQQEPLSDGGFTNYYIVNLIPEYTKDEWVNFIYDQNLSWYVTTPPAETLYSKASAELFVVFNENNPSTAYLIYNQANI